MNTVEQLLSLAETNPGDTVTNLEYHDNDHIVITTNHINITTTIDELEAAGKKMSSERIVTTFRVCRPHSTFLGSSTLCEAT